MGSNLDLLFWGKFSEALKSRDELYPAGNQRTTTRHEAFFDNKKDNNDANVELLWHWDCQKNPHGSTTEIKPPHQEPRDCESLEKYAENNYCSVYRAERKRD